MPDWSGLWFKLIEEVAGEFTGIRFGTRMRAEDPITWIFVPHADFDGVGAFAHLLRTAPYGLESLSLPQLREAKSPSLFARWKALFRFLLLKPKQPAAWKGSECDWRPSGRAQIQESAFAAELWEIESTARLSARAQAYGVSLNTLLFWALGRATASELGEGAALWMMPVNMRGPVAKPCDTANHASYVEVALSPGIAAREIHAQIKDALRRGEHWGVWSALNVGRYIGYRGMRWLYARNHGRGRAWVGAFSNLGNWEGLGEGAPAWFFCPPVALGCPLGAGAVICDGRLSLTLEAHPSLARDSTGMRRLMDRWIAEIQSARTINAEAARPLSGNRGTPGSSLSVPDRSL